MLRLFARRQDSHPSSEPGIGPARSADWPGRRARRRARPEAEALDSRLLMASASLGMTDATASPALSGRVAQVLKPYFDQHRIPGISVAIVTDGQIALAQGYGLNNVATGAPVEAHTRFDIGSVTKTFTAIGVMLLYQDSQGTSHPLDLNAPISEYLKNTPSFKLPRKWSGVTTKELLDMSSGIGNGPGALPWQAQVKSIAKAPSSSPLGRRPSIAIRITTCSASLSSSGPGKSTVPSSRSGSWNRSACPKTQELGRSPKVPNQAVGYDAPRHGSWPRAKLQNGPELYAAAGMVSTAQDMATYLAALLRGRLLDRATYKLMWTSTPTPQYGVNPPSNSLRGLGWDTAIGTNTRPTKVTKGGSVPGFISEIILYPTSDSGVFVSINTNPTGSRRASRVTALQMAESVYAATRTGSLTEG